MAQAVHRSGLRLWWLPTHLEDESPKSDGNEEPDVVQEDSNQESGQGEAPDAGVSREREKLHPPSAPPSTRQSNAQPCKYPLRNRLGPTF